MDQHEEFREASHECMDLMLNVGLMTSVSDAWPPEVQHSWAARIHEMRDEMSSWIHEAQEFASSYD